MPIAAHIAGGHSTLDLLIGLAVLIWALAGAAVLAGWRTRFARRRQRSQRPSLRGALGARVPRLQASAAGARDSAPTPTVAPSRGVPSTAAAESSASTPTGAAAPAETPVGVIVGARISPETLEPLGQRVDNSRRLAVARARLGEVLTALRGDRWFVERNVVFAAHPIPFLILGETGVFALWGDSSRSFVAGITYVELSVYGVGRSKTCIIAWTISVCAWVAVCVRAFAMANGICFAMAFVSFTAPEMSRSTENFTGVPRFDHRLRLWVMKAAYFSA